MSVDLPSMGTPGSTLPPVRGPINDIIIIFGGWGNVAGGDPLAAGPGSSTSRLLLDVMALPPNLRTRKVLALEGSIRSGGVDQALSFIRANFHPSGSLIIYGYSAGGTDALALTRQIESTMSWYSYSSGRLLDVFGMEDRMSSDAMGAVRVDLLITVDAATGPLTVGLDRTVPPCVRVNLNFFQTTPSRIMSHGGANVAVDPGATTVRNVAKSGAGVTHGNMGELTNSEALEAIRKVLGGDVGDFPTNPSGGVPA
jgi:hypothetical protein